MALNITVPARLRTAWVGRQAGQTDAQAAAAGATPIRAADMAALDQRTVDALKAASDLDADKVSSAQVGEVVVVSPQGYADLGSGVKPGTAYLQTLDPWAASTAYTTGQVVEQEGAAFRCVTAHTSQAAGMAFDRAKWAPIDVNELALPTTVPVRRQAGVTAATAPRVGVFQGRPKTFLEKGKRPLWVPGSNPTANVTASSGSVAAGTAPSGSLVFTGTSSSATMNMPLPAPVNLTGKHVLILLKMQTVASRAVNIHLTSAANGTDYTNHIDMAIVSGNVDAPGVDKWHKTSMSPGDGVVVGTGADLAAITGVRVASRLGTNVVELGGIWARDNAADKAKAVLWLDDGGYGNQAHQNALKVAARYGFPVTTAFIASNIFTGSGPQLADLRFLQDHFGLQFAVHANGPQDHNTTQTGQVAFEQLLEYQATARAVGLRGTDHGAFWNPGFNGPNTDEDAATVHKLFTTMRGGRARLPESNPPGDPKQTRALLLNTSQVLADLTPNAERAIASKGVAQYVWHDISAANLSGQFEPLCAWLDARRDQIDVVTAAGAFDPLCG